MKKLCLLTLALCFVLLTAVSAHAEDALFAGAGTPENPYLISTAEDLAALSALVSNLDLFYDDYERYRAYNDADKHYRLTADIALNDCSGFDAWAETPPANVFTPIGHFRTFDGVFDGSGHTISGLYIGQPVAKDKYGDLMYAFGLFGNLKGEVRNLTLTKAFVSPKDVNDIRPPTAGILAGMNQGVIRSCTVEGVVIAEGTYAGGVAGDNTGGEIADCTFEGTIIEPEGSSGGSIGGITGSGGNIRSCSVNAQLLCEKTDPLSVCASMGGIIGMHMAFVEDQIIENCTFEGTILSGRSAGGIVGSAHTASFKEYPAKTTIRGCVNRGAVTAVMEAGGIVGSAMSTSPHGELWVEDCINAGDVRCLDTRTYAAGGIVGGIITKKEGPVHIIGCTNEAPIRSAIPGGIVGQLMQLKGNVYLQGCTNKGDIHAEGSYAAGILCHIQQLGDNWSVVIDGCVNEGDIITSANAGGIVCFAYDAGQGPGRSMTLSGCINRGSLRSSGGNNYMGGILGVNALAQMPVRIVGCVNEGNLEYTGDVVVDALTLSGNLFTLARTSGGIVGHVGFAPYLTVNTGARTVGNIQTEDAWLRIEDCASTGRFLHQQARFADDVTESVIENWRLSGYDNLLNFFIALEGGIVGTIADSKSFSVSTSGCTFTNAQREIDDWNNYPVKQAP